MLRSSENKKWFGIMVAVVGCLFVAGAVRAEEPFDYFSNSWNVIGLKDYSRGTRITPGNRLMIGSRIKNHASAEKATVRMRFGRQLQALSRKQTKRCLDGWLPVILLTAWDKQVRYDFTLWATPLPTVKDWKKEFDWPNESENYLNWIMVKVTNTGTTTAEAKFRAEQCGPYEKEKHPVAELAEPKEFSWSLAGGDSAECVVRIPANIFKYIAVKGSDFSDEDPKQWLDRTVWYWRGIMAKAARIEVPCQKATQAYLASLVCQLIASDRGDIHGGEGFYDEFWIRDGAYQLMALEEAGLLDMVRNAIKSYLSHQRPDGRFESQWNEFDANGQAVWCLWQFYKITADRHWLESVYPQMRRAVEWTMKARRRAPADSPFAGVLPAGFADGEYLHDAKHHIVGYDFWNLRGMLCTADAARALGRADEANELLREAELYRAAIDAAWKRTGVAYFPPSWEKKGTHWGNTETLWPTELFARDDPRITALIAEVRRRHGGGFVEGIIRWTGSKEEAIHPYMGAYTVMASLIRGEHERVVEDFYWYLLHSTATHAFPEGIFYKRRFAWGNTIPHVTGACNYAILLRHMLVHEKGDELHLLSAVPDWWLGEGRGICIERTHTHFGVMSLRVRGTTKGVQVDLEGPLRQLPKRIVLHLPESRPLVGSAKGIEVVVRPNQKKRWDFPSVIGLYRRQAVPLIESIE